MQEKTVVGIVGMPGSGKSLAIEAAKKLGFAVVIMGDEVREEARKRRLEPTPENIGKLMLQLRRENGPAVIAECCIPKIEEASKKHVLVDGLRNLDEVEAFKKHFRNFMLIAVHASQETRFQRLFRRKRSDAPANWKGFLERDMREISVGIGGVIALADYMIVNEGTFEQCQTRIQKMLERIMRNG